MYNKTLAQQNEQEIKYKSNDNYMYLYDGLRLEIL
jgi:hypothetical protein